MGWLVLIECQTQNKSFSFHCWVGPKLWPYFHLYYLARLCSPLVSQCYLAVTDAYWIHPVLPSLLDFYSSLYLFVKAAGEVDDRVAFIDLFKYKICLTIAGVIPHAFVFLRRDFKCATLRFKIISWMWGEPKAKLEVIICAPTEGQQTFTRHVLVIKTVYESKDFNLRHTVQPQTESSG